MIIKNNVKHKGKYINSIIEIIQDRRVIKRISQNYVHLYFLASTVPHKLKLAKVIPLHMSEKKHLITNYRPLSVLSQFYKILEKCQ